MCIYKYLFCPMYICRNSTTPLVILKVLFICKTPVKTFFSSFSAVSSQIEQKHYVLFTKCRYVVWCRVSSRSVTSREVPGRSWDRTGQYLETLKVPGLRRTKSLPDWQKKCQNCSKIVQNYLFSFFFLPNVQVVIVSFKVRISDTEMKRMQKKKKKQKKPTFFTNFLFFFLYFCPPSQPGKSRDKRSTVPGPLGCLGRELKI